MEPFIIVLTAIWIYPVLSLFVMLPLRDKPRSRKIVLIFVGLLAFITLIGIVSGYSTVNENVDWIFVSFIYLFVCLLIWRTIFQPNRWIKVLGFMLMLFTFGCGYFFGSVGILGIAYTLGEYEHQGKIPINDRLSYSESVLGNATSDYRGKRIVIWANPKYFSFLEYEVLERSYYDINQFSVPVKAHYDEQKNLLYVSIPEQKKSKYHQEGWCDTLDLNSTGK